MDFVTGFPISANQKNDSYNSILVIVDWLIKIVNYESVKVRINILNLAKVIMDVIVRYYGVPKSIVINQSSLFISKFGSLLCYFLKIKKSYLQLFTPKQMVKQRDKIV